MGFLTLSCSIGYHDASIIGIDRTDPMGIADNDILKITAFLEQFFQIECTVQTVAVRDT